MFGLGICFVHASLRLPSDSEDPGALPPWPDTPYFRGASPAHRATCTGSGVASRVTANTCGLVQAQSLCVFSAQVSVPVEGDVNVFKMPTEAFGQVFLYTGLVHVLWMWVMTRAWPWSRDAPARALLWASQQCHLWQAIQSLWSQLYHFKLTKWVSWFLYSFDAFFCIYHYRFLPHHTNCLTTSAYSMLYWSNFLKARIYMYLKCPEMSWSNFLLLLAFVFCFGMKCDIVNVLSIHCRRIWKCRN